MPRTSMTPGGRIVRALLAAAIALIAVAALSGSRASADILGRYVALRDSYTAGPLIPNQSLNPLGCLRSDQNYPREVQRALRFTSFADVSCSGADTGDMTQPQNVTPGPNPPQFNALTAGTTVVTLGIGGNDIGFNAAAPVHPNARGMDGMAAVVVAAINAHS
jgi:GDSL-like Lipase/Acylhydrolase family